MIFIRTRACRWPRRYPTIIPNIDRARGYTLEPIQKARINVSCLFVRSTSKPTAYCLRFLGELVGAVGVSVFKAGKKGMAASRLPLISLQYLLFWPGFASQPDNRHPTGPVRNKAEGNFLRPSLAVISYQAGLFLPFFLIIRGYNLSRGGAYPPGQGRSGMPRKWIQGSHPLTGPRHHPVTP
jgi:hypothetical protein